VATSNLETSGSDEDSLSKRAHKTPKRFIDEKSDDCETDGSNPSPPIKRPLVDLTSSRKSSSAEQLQKKTATPQREVSESSPRSQGQSSTGRRLAGRELLPPEVRNNSAADAIPTG
jgi:hypothetical protein